MDNPGEVAKKNNNNNDAHETKDPKFEKPITDIGKANGKIDFLKYQNELLENEIKTVRAIKRSRGWDNDERTEQAMMDRDMTAMEKLYQIAVNEKSVPVAELIKAYRSTLQDYQLRHSRVWTKKNDADLKIRKLKGENKMLKIKSRGTSGSERKYRIVPQKANPNDADAERLVLVILIGEYETGYWLLFEEEVFNELELCDCIDVKYAHKYPGAEVEDPGDDFFVSSIKARKLFEQPWTEEFFLEHIDLISTIDAGFYRLRKYIYKREKTFEPHLTFAEQCRYFKQFLTEKACDGGSSEFLFNAKYAGFHQSVEHIAIDPTKHKIVDIYIKCTEHDTDSCIQ